MTQPLFEVVAEGVVTVDEHPGPEFIGPPTVEEIIAFEEGAMELQQFVEFFSRLIATGLVWQLQGVYGRTAASLIENGFVDRDGVINQDAVDAVLDD